MVTYDQVHELVTKLPTTKLPDAYNLLLDLMVKPKENMIDPISFMQLPLAERRRLMAQQAATMVEEYEGTSDERTEWQAGDFLED